MVLAAEYSEGYKTRRSNAAYDNMVLSLVCPTWIWHCRAETCRVNLRKYHIL
jgi:iron only hydrogenase large subunit-like protein